MKLVIGGYAQGKLKHVLKTYHVETYTMCDGMIPKKTESMDGTVILNHFHNWVRECISHGGCPEEEILTFLESHGDCIIISDEIGNGIVPIDAGEREYRERVGRMLTELAKRAEEVERIICGIGQRIK